MSPQSLIRWLAACALCIACTRYDDDPTLKDVSNQAQRFEGNSVVVVGRSAEQPDHSSVLTWPASQMVTRFSGTSVIANMNLVGGKSTNFVQVVLDGNDRTILAIDTNTTQYTITAEGDGPHTLSVVKLNEAMDGTIIFSGFTPGAGGELLPTALPTGRRIEFIGDSITCGYGNLGTITSEMLTSSTDADANNLRDCNHFLGKKVYQESSGYMAYGAQTARLLNAEWHSTCWSGKGVYRNADGTQDETIPKIWQRSVADDGNTTTDFAAWVPQVVFIDLGTNDFGSIAQSNQVGGGVPDLAAFRAAYLEMLKQVRYNWPNAWIFLANGPMLSDYYPTTFKALTTARAQLKQIIKTFGDKRVRYFEFPLNIASNEDATGCEWHPDIAQDTKMAKQLYLTILDTLGWE